MSFSLLITGLCSFVPKLPIEEKENEMNVLMVESAMELPGEHQHPGHEVHFPALICPKGKVLDGYRVPDATFLSTPYVLPQDGVRSSDHDDEEMAVFYLDDQEIALENACCNALEIFIGDDYTLPCPKKPNPESFRWVVAIGDVNPGSELVRDRCFTDDDCDPYVISRLLLTEGSIRTGKMATNLKGDICRWNFEENGESSHYRNGNSQPRDTSRALAAVVKYTYESQSPIKIETRLLKTRHTPRTSKNRRVAKLFDRSRREPLTIALEPDTEAWIKVMPLLDILQIRQLGERYSDPHFAHIYKVSDRFGEISLKTPYFAGTCPEFQDFRHLGGTDCPPKQGTHIQTLRRKDKDGASQ